MSIINLQRGIAEAGRIRIGQQVDAGRGRTRPSKLDTFRLTSPDRRRIEQLAEMHGGTVEEWAAPSGKQWQVITAATSLDVIVPPSDLSFSQSYELWSAGGCQRRCDGVTESIGEQACLCDPDNRECSIHTRLSVLIRDLPGLGVWRIDTSGYYAAVELASAVEIISLAAGRGALLPARLRLEQRSVKRPGKDGKPQTLRFAVPVLDVEVTPAQLLSGGAQPVQLAEAGRPRLTPVPQLTGGEAGPTIAEQSAAPVERPRRANSAPELPSSGRRRSARAVAPASEQPEQGAVDTGAGESQPAEVDDERTAPAPASQPAARPRRQAKPADNEPAQDAEYWMKRVHAAARERGIDHTGLRLIAAAALGIEQGDIEAFSSKDLVVEEFQSIDNILRSLPDTIKGPTACEEHEQDDDCADLDAISTWVWPRVNAKGLDSWDAVDVVAVAATGKQPNDLGVAEWVAWTIRLGAGEYDAQRGAA